MAQIPKGRLVKGPKINQYVGTVSHLLLPWCRSWRSRFFPQFLRSVKLESSSPKVRDKRPMAALKKSSVFFVVFFHLRNICIFMESTIPAYWYGYFPSQKYLENDFDGMPAYVRMLPGSTSEKNTSDAFVPNL